MNKKSYWDGRFSRENRIWGDSPSTSAAIALDLFSQHNVESILVPGAGYGRNSKVFSDAGYHVVGVEISGVALKLAEDFDPLTTFHELSALDLLSSKVSISNILASLPSCCTQSLPLAFVQVV